MIQLYDNYQINSFSRSVFENGLLIDVSNTAESIGFNSPVALSKAYYTTL